MVSDGERPAGLSARPARPRGKGDCLYTEEGIANHEEIGGVTMRSQYLAFLAEAYAKGQQVEEGLRRLAEALDIANTTGDCFYEAELYRLKGELLHQQSHEQYAEAEVCFYTAIDVARSQHAKSWELRAATSLARLWRQRGKNVEARDLLAPVYAWFTEGFDTKDLQDAKTLLNELR